MGLAFLKAGCLEILKAGLDLLVKSAAFSGYTSEWQEKEAISQPVTTAEIPSTGKYL